jgi:hypothetical protein
MGTIVAALAITAALAVPASSALAGGGPVATKSGAIVNYVSTAKVKLGKRSGPSFVCSVTCNLTSKLVLKGPHLKLPDTETASSVPAGQALTHFFNFSKFPKSVRQFIAQHVGQYTLVSTVNATDAATGATDAISNVFKLKR